MVADAALARRGRRPLGQLVRVADTGDRYSGTSGTVSEHVVGFGTVMYRLSASRVREYGRERAVEGWACLFFPNQLRAVTAKKQ